MRLLKEFSSFSLLPAAFWLGVQLATILSLAEAEAAVIVAQGKQASGDPAALVEVVICTTTGVKKVTLNADGSLPEEVTTAPDCRWCTPVDLVDEVEPACGSVLTATLSCVTSSFPYSVLPKTKTVSHKSAAIRAPPLLEA